MKGNNQFYLVLKIFIILTCIAYAFQYFFDPGNTKNEIKIDATTSTLIEKIENINNNKVATTIKQFPLYGDMVKKHSLCRYNVDENYSSEAEECPTNGIVTVQQGGRLGNQIWEYISVWVVAQETGLAPYVPKCIKSRLEKLFENLFIPDLDEIRNCPMEKPIYATRDINETGAKNHSIILKMWVVQPDLLAKRMEDIKKLYTIRKNLLEKSQVILKSGVDSMNSTIDTFIGIHVRRTDYISYLQRKYQFVPDPTKFFYAAMRVFEKKYPNSIFVIVSDDPKWCFQEFGNRTNVYVAGIKHKSSPELDIAIMASCNHSIIDYGTYGQWGALLAGGETIYYGIDPTYSSDQLGKNLPNWITLNETDY